MICCTAALAANPATQNNGADSDSIQMTHTPEPDASTPRGALHAADLAIRKGGIDAAMAFYHTTSVRDREIARCLAQADVACGHLEDALVQKFGRASADTALHAFGAKVGSDLDAADVTIERNTAVIHWPHDDQPLHMVKSGGDWKVEVAAELASLDEHQVTDFAEFLKHFAVAADRLADQVTAGRLATEQAATDACQHERQLLVRNDK
jgi:hypothetical protein